MRLEPIDGQPDLLVDIAEVLPLRQIVEVDLLDPVDDLAQQLPDYMAL